MAADAIRPRPAGPGGEASGARTGSVGAGVARWSGSDERASCAVETRPDQLPEVLSRGLGELRPGAGAVAAVQNVGLVLEVVGGGQGRHHVVCKRVVSTTVPRRAFR